MRNNGKGIIYTGYHRKVILVGVQLDNGENEESLLDELEELVKTAGGVIVGRMIQSREQFHLQLILEKES